jgi:hypothetical protein
LFALSQFEGDIKGAAMRADALTLCRLGIKADVEDASIFANDSFRTGDRFKNVSGAGGLIARHEPQSG